METTSMRQTNLPQKSGLSSQKSNGSNKTIVTATIKMCYMLRRTSLVRPSLANGVNISDTTRFFSSEEWSKTINNPGALKIIRDCPICNNKAEDLKRRKCENRNGTGNTSNTNAEITKEYITELHASRPGSDGTYAKAIRS